MSKRAPTALGNLLPSLGRRTSIMGVVNVTPDSFSDGGRFARPKDALAHALALAELGADILDIGGESTRPGAEPVPADVELARVLPIFEGLAAKTRCVLSIDTTKAIVAARAVEAGATLVNDISGLAFDAEMAPFLAKAGVAAVLGHARGAPKTMQEGRIEYANGVVCEVRDALGRSIEAACRAGMSKDAIIVDPGIGFGKTVEQNLELLSDLRAFEALGCPILVGTSRKAFIGAITNRDVHERMFGTAATIAIAIANGASIVRVHDVREMRDVASVADAIVRLDLAQHRRRKSARE